MWVFWLTPVQTNEGELWRVVLAVALLAAVLAVSAGSHRATTAGAET
jgi:hypothetical protein